MDINLILGILLVLFILYFLALVFSLRRLNQQAQQASQWNKFRNQLFVQAQEDQVKAHRISVSIQKQYGGLGVPYQEDRDQAYALLKRISTNAQAILADQNNRTPIQPNTEPYSWKTFLISPLRQEYRNRQEWWETTQELGSRLSRNPSGFSSVEKLEIRLAEKGKQTKAELRTLRKKTRKLLDTYLAEARTPTHFQDQIQLVFELNMHGVYQKSASLRRGISVSI